jgi:hypothetical protein
MRNPAQIVSEAFIWAVGITRPKPGQERRAALFITFCLVGVLCAVAAMFWLLLRFI